MKTSRKKETRVARVGICPHCGTETFVIEENTNVGHCTCPNCGVTLHLDGRKTRITVSGKNAVEVQEVSLALLEKTKPSHTSSSPWVSGSFYLIVFIVVIAALSVAGHILPLITFPLVLIGGLLALSVIGAFQMRQDEKLSEANFLKLMALSFKYLPWLRRQKTEES